MTHIGKIRFGDTLRQRWCHGSHSLQPRAPFSRVFGRAHITSFDGGRFWSQTPNLHFRMRRRIPHSTLASQPASCTFSPDMQQQSCCHLGFLLSIPGNGPLVKGVHTDVALIVPSGSFRDADPRFPNGFFFLFSPFVPHRVSSPVSFVN